MEKGRCLFWLITRKRNCMSFAWLPWIGNSFNGGQEFFTGAETFSKKTATETRDWRESGKSLEIFGEKPVLVYRLVYTYDHVYE